ncbi:hypothetical protein EVAR_64711_1 [Eumeta japonica]|uniref:Uncharacterized protein n=1 Tax=Eumeta variegata TaxID=151549 RepID=A0A4C1ZR61_EUMVA|nr:hypothetical protein EVAR_64711_1 [Eumeta japonica]
MATPPQTAMRTLGAEVLGPALTRECLRTRDSAFRLAPHPHQSVDDARSSTAERHPRPLWEAQRSPVPPPVSATAGSSSFGDDIQTVMAVLRAVSSSEIAEFASQPEHAATWRKTPRSVDAANRRILPSSLNANGLSNNILELKVYVGLRYRHCANTGNVLKPNRPRACTIAGYVQLRTDRTHASRSPSTLPSPKPLHRRDLKALLALGAVILFGDCKNPRWGCPVLDYNGDKLDRLQDRLEFEIIAPSTATHFPIT